MNYLSTLATCIALGSLVAAASAEVLPSGLDANGQLQAVALPESSEFGWTRLQNGIQFRRPGLLKNVIFYGPGIVRVSANSGTNHLPQPSLVVVAKSSGAFRVEEKPESLELISEALRVQVDKKSGVVAFLRPDGSAITRESGTELKEVSISSAPTFEVKQTYSLSPDESLYGLGQFNDPYMDYRGKQALLVQTNIGIVVPFLISTRRYGILWDICSKSIFRDDNSGASFWSESAPAGVDYYFMAGQNMDSVIAGYRYLTGAAPMFPKAAFGLFMSKERYKTQDRLIEVVREFRKDGFPLDYIVQDWQYWGGDKDGTWSGMIWNKERFPDPSQLTRTLHDELHVRLMNSIWPSVGNDTDLARELDAKKLRFEQLHWISKKARIYDAFSPEGRAIYFKHIKTGLLDVGVDALWMDGTEVEVGTACQDAARVEADIKSLGKNAMGDFTRYLNVYSLETTKGVYEGQRAIGNRRVLTLTRSSWAGQQRYGALAWSGDTNASWKTFRNQISGGINVAMAGQPYWTQDTGGFFVNYKGGEKNPEYRELFARWNQFAIFNPIYRIHGTSIEREPYLFRTLDPEIYQSLLSAAQLRYRLLPYIYSLAWQSTSAGYTMMRGLPMDFPDDRNARKLDDTFMFGPGFLVHPVTWAMFHAPPPPAPAIPTEFLQTPEGQAGLNVEYFAGRNFETSVSRSVDTTIDHTWPGPPLQTWPAGLTSGDNFSGRWEGSLLVPQDGEYEIGVEGDDGYRLWLDGKLVAEDWKVRPPTWKSVKMNLHRGDKLPVKIEYFQGGNARLLRFGWRTPEMLAKPEGPNQVADTYLPAGAEWYDFWTADRFPGGQTLNRKCPIDVLPLYVRAGSIVPMGPNVQYATEQPGAPMEIRIYPGADARFTLYEDDHETYAYEKGQYATVDLAWNDAARTLTVSDRKGKFPGMIPNRVLNVVLVGSGTKTLEHSGKTVRCGWP